ncbi:MAG TPA: hypothetical protein VEJ18_01940 [Planctomycetota bacterium]|nr:hypothetical protein [Planctomycetota bacterium]
MLSVLLALLATQDFKAGASAVDVTPPLGEPIVGGWSDPPATEIHDRLYARCLVLDDGTTRLAIVTVDNVGIGRDVLDAARRQVTDETGLPGSHLLVSATHTHSATYARKLRDGYPTTLAARIAEAVKAAVGNLQPAKIGWGTAQAPEHLFNRRYVLKEGVRIPDPFGGEDKVLMNPGVGNADVVRPAGPTDPEIVFISVRSKEGRPLALFATYSLHYVGGVPPGQVSADYFAVFSAEVGRLLKADDRFVGALSNGTSGDVNNIDVLGGTTKGKKPYEQMEYVGKSVAAKVAEAEGSIDYKERVALSARMEELTLGARRPSTEQVARAKAILERPKDAKAGHVREVVYANRTLALADLPETVSVPLQVLRIGELRIAAIPFEVFTDIGLELKRRGPGKTFVVSLANGSFGYLPTPEHHALGGYETWLGTNKVETQASVKIVEKLLGMMQ